MVLMAVMSADGMTEIKTDFLKKEPVGCADQTADRAETRNLS